MAKSQSFNDEVSALGSVLKALGSLDADNQRWVMNSAAEKLGIPFGTARSTTSQSASGGLNGDNSDTDTTDVGKLTPKQFINAKAPKTDVERVACLAYYLAHGRDQHAFKTADISKLNTEAAQPKLSNATVAIRNATTQSRFLAPAGRGQKQIAALGEKVVMALPNRDAVKEAMDSGKVRRRRTRRSKKGTKAS